MQDAAASVKPKVRWLRFSLRTAVVVITLFGLWLGWTVNRARQEKQAVDKILAHGGTVAYAHQVDADGVVSKNAVIPGPSWLRRQIGDEYFQSVAAVELRDESILLDVKLVEISPDKLRTNDDETTPHGILAPDRNTLLRSDKRSGTPVLVDDQLVGVINTPERFAATVAALRDAEGAKFLAEPALMTVSGRPVSFHQGGESPTLVQHGVGNDSIGYSRVGTRVDFVPIALGNGKLRLTVRLAYNRPEVSQAAAAGGVRIPHVRSQWIDTAAELPAQASMVVALPALRGTAGGEEEEIFMVALVEPKRIGGWLALSELHKLRRLETVRLVLGKITSAEVRQLRQLHHLTTLELNGVEISADDLAELRQALPGCKIVR